MQAFTGLYFKLYIVAGLFEGLRENFALCYGAGFVAPIFCMIVVRVQKCGCLEPCIHRHAVFANWPIQLLLRHFEGGLHELPQTAPK